MGVWFVILIIIFVTLTHFQPLILSVGGHFKKFLALPFLASDHSKAVHLLWIIYVISVLFCYAFMHVCLLMPRGHLLGKG